MNCSFCATAGAASAAAESAAMTMLVRLICILLVWFTFPVGCGWSPPQRPGWPAHAATAKTNASLSLLLRKAAASIAPSVREGPQAQLLLRDLPQPGKPVGLHDQEEDDEAAEDHQLQVGHGGVRDFHAERVRHPARGEVEENRKQRDEGRPEEGPEDRPHPPDDDHEEDAEGQVRSEEGRVG